MESFETMIRKCPDLTGREYLELQAQQKNEREQRLKDEHTEAAAWMEDINTNGGYFYFNGKPNQSWFYKVTNVRMSFRSILLMDLKQLWIHKNSSCIIKYYPLIKGCGVDSYGLRSSSNIVTRIDKQIWDDVLKDLDQFVDRYSNFQPLKSE